MSETVRRLAASRRRRHGTRPRASDPRVVRTRAAVIEAARTLFLQQGYTRTTMEQIAARAGLTKRTVYNNYPDKDALFTQIVTELTAYAAAFGREVREDCRAGVTAATLPGTLEALAARLALAIVRPEVIAVRRLLIGEARHFPALAADYFARVPGQVLTALAASFAALGHTGVLRLTDPKRAAAQFAYLVVGEPLDRAMVVGTMPSRAHLVACAHDGVVTFLARYAARPGRHRASARHPRG